MSYLQPEQWVPVDVEALETAADSVVRSCENAIVVAGPGAGKTELLAQRASFLLDTQTCREPRRILAISFKRDAASNLKERVVRRCGDKARRFDSFTLDAFAKALVDRFYLALPGNWRPAKDYEVVTKSLTPDEIRVWFKQQAKYLGNDLQGKAVFSDDECKRFFDSICHGHRLPYEFEQATGIEATLGLQWWNESLGDKKTRSSRLTFPMMCRLAAYILTLNPKVTTALRATYSHIFVDEFQDTTSAQYDLISTAFSRSTSLITAVGDSKQRIMTWAGAKKDIFDVYCTEFGARKYWLIRNYRSAPELVAMQHVIAQTIESGDPPPVPMKSNITGVCEVLEFSTPEAEANYLADLISAEILRGKKPRDFCVLVRQQTGKMTGYLASALAARNIQMRDESSLQDLLSEPVVKFVVSLLLLAARDRHPDSWIFLNQEISVLLGIDDADASPLVETTATRMLQHTRQSIGTGRCLAELPRELINILGEGTFRSTYRQYSMGSFLWETIDRLSAELRHASAKWSTAVEVIDSLVGEHVVPAMTIHKCKGLEFHTVIFLGLEDSQWRNFLKEAEEEKRNFFVAFSRAIERTYFTYAHERDGKHGRWPQKRTQIGDLFQVLSNAGVPIRNCG